MVEHEFEWDGVKAKSNLAQHKVTFQAGIYAFDDPFGLERLDVGCTDAEARYVIVAMAKGVLLTVVYTERGPRTRIISVRKATSHEQREYYHSQTRG